ncbi:MAG: hypothetical protein IKW26_05150, partial [Treponema sp.]|nr:hypothetical protein [Treponema sp.]
TQHNTTQHIEETLSTTINSSGTRPAWNFSHEKFPAGLFSFKSLSRGNFPAQCWEKINFLGGF